MGMYRGALAIHEQLGDSADISADYCNLGIIADQRGETALARKLWTKARDKLTELGLFEEVEKVQRWIDKLQIEVADDSRPAKSRHMLKPGADALEEPANRRKTGPRKRGKSN
jgi:hypothetical protein